MSNNSVSFALLVKCLDRLINWQTFGINLPGIKKEHIQQIEADHRDVNQQKSALCKVWLRVHPNAKWEDVITALEQARQYALAKKIKAKIELKEVLKEVLHEERMHSLAKYNGYIREFEAQMKWKECVHVAEIKEHCQLFLNSLCSQDDLNIANVLAKKWDTIFNRQLGISLNWNEKAVEESYVKVKHTTEFPLSDEKSSDVDYPPNASYFGKQTLMDHFGKTHFDTKPTTTSPSYPRAEQTKFSPSYDEAEQTKFSLSYDEDRQTELNLAVAGPLHVF